MKLDPPQMSPSRQARNRSSAPRMREDVFKNNMRQDSRNSIQEYMKV